MCIPVYANDVARQTNSTTDAEEVLEQLEDMGFWEKEGVSVANGSSVLEYTRFDGVKSMVEISENADNEIVTFRSEGKENTLVVTADGEYYWDEVAEENKIEVNVTSPELISFSAEPKITAETWVTNITPYDNGPYTINRNMKYNTDINFNRNLGTLTLEAIMAILVPEVAVLNYFEQYFSMLTVGCELINIYVDLNPNLKTMYVQEQYYNGDSDTSGRPLEYCYKVHVKFAEDASFSTFVELDNGVNYQTMYAKQLIYA